MGLWTWGGVADKFATGFVTGAVAAAVIAVTAIAVVAAIPAAATVVTASLAAAAVIGGVGAAASLYVDHSAENVAYTLGALVGGIVIGGLTGRALAEDLSPPGNKPKPGLKAWDPRADAKQYWKYNRDQSLNENFTKAMGTGPNCLSGAGSVALGGTGVAAEARSIEQIFGNYDGNTNAK